MIDKSCVDSRVRMLCVSLIKESSIIIKEGLMGIH
jgi:hypothetical protein